MEPGTVYLTLIFQQLAERKLSSEEYPTQGAKKVSVLRVASHRRTCDLLGSDRPQQTMESGTVYLTLIFQQLAERNSGASVLAGCQFIVCKTQVLLLPSVRYLESQGKPKL